MAFTARRCNRFSDKSRARGNVSSIMVRNAPSIMPAQSGAGYRRLTQNIKRIPTRFCHDLRTRPGE
jgi:hypothetical protein